MDALHLINYAMLSIALAALAITFFIQSRKWKERLNTLQNNGSNQNGGIPEEVCKHLKLALDTGNVSVWRYNIKQDRFEALIGEIIAREYSTLETWGENLTLQSRAEYHQIFDNLLSGKTERESTIFEFTNTSNNQIVYITSEMGIEKDSSGQIIYIIGTQRDVSVEKNQERRIEEILLTQELALKTGKISISDYDLQNNHYKLYLGKTVIQEHFSSWKSLHTLVHPDDIEQLTTYNSNLLESGKNEGEIMIRIKYPSDSTYRRTLSSILVIRDENNMPLRIISTNKDISEIFHYQQELEKKLSLLKIIYDNLPIGLSYFDAQGDLINTNKAYLEMIGYTETFNKTDKSHINLFELDEFSDETKQKLRLGENVNLTLAINNNKNKHLPSTPKDNQLNIHLDFKTVTIKDAQNAITGYLCISNDMTERIENSKKMEELALRYKTVFNSIKSGIEIRNKEDVILDTNATLFEILGITDQEKFLSAQRKMEQNPNLSEDIKFKIANFEPFTSYIKYDFDKINETQYFQSSKKGTAILEIKHTPLINKNGEIEGRVIMSADVTENANLNRKYKQLFERQNNFMELLPIGVNIYNKEGVLIFQNQASQQLLGSPNLKGKINLFENPLFKFREIDKLKNGERIDVVLNCDFSQDNMKTHFESKHNNIICLEVYASPINDENGKIEDYITIIQDVTHREYSKKKLEESSLKMKLAIKSSDIMAWDYDCVTGIFTTLFEDKSIQGSEITIDNYIEYTHPDDLAATQESFDILRYGIDKSFQIDLRFKTPGLNHWHHGTVSGQPYEYGENGEVTKFTGFRKDTSKWKNLTNELEFSNSQNKLILNNTQSAFIYFSPDLRVHWENASTIFADEPFVSLYTKGCICYEQKGQSAPCDNCPVLKSIETKSIVNQEMPLSPNIVTETISTPIINENNEIEGIVLRVDNITERKAMYNELQTAKEKAEQSNHLKSAFLANMSHEIRTPLNAIVGFSDLVIQTEDQEEKTEFQKIISTNCELLLNLINDILDLSKIESGFLEFNPSKIDFNSLFKELQSSFSLSLKPAIKIQYSTPLQYCTSNDLDKQRIIQIMTNFITNAIKFTEKGNITIGYEPQQNGIKLYVSDTGIGISDENKKKVFQRFQKFDTFTQGTGLGLSISKAIADANNGEIGFESQKDKGSTFWVSLPCSLTTTSSTQTADILPIEETTSKDQPREKENTQIKILVAEDNDSNYMLIRSLLKTYQIERAINGVEAIEKTKSNTYNLIFMDMKMPIMDGLKATQNIRTFDKTIPIVALTANAFDSDRNDAIEAGCTEFLTKPINKELIISTIKRLTDTTIK